MLNTIQSKNNRRNILRVVLVTFGLLLIPLIGNWPWNPSDYIVAGILLLGVGLTYELLVKRVKNNANRIYLATALVIAFLLIWMELAVGLFGSPFAGS